MVKVESKLSLFFRILSFTGPHKVWLLIRIAGACISAAVDIALAYIVVQLVDFSLTGKTHEVISTIYTLSAVVAIGIIFSMINKYASGRVCILSGRDMRRHLVKDTGKLPAAYMDEENTGSFLSMMTNDVGIVQGFLEEGLPGLVFQPVRLLGAAAYMLTVNWKLLLVSVIIIPTAIFAADLISRPVARYTEKLQELMGKMNAILQDAISGIFILKAFNLQKVLLGKYGSEVDKALDRSLSIEKRFALLAPVNIIIQIMPFVLCILYGGYQTINGSISPGVLLAFIQMMNYIVEPAELVPGLISSLKSTMGAAEHLFGISDLEPERTGGKKFKTTGQDDCCAVELINASFSYDGSAKILDGLDLSLHQGETTALVGLNGSGKSTLIKLICGFYRLDQGCLRLYGHDLDEWDLAEARSRIAVVSQDTYLFPVSIAENIAYGRPGASTAEIVEAAKKANAHEFIMELPEGYATEAGERGARLSGGQKQRIAIARAVLKDAPVLLLDEPTSTLDTQSEMYVQEALEEFMKNRTVLIIAHRLSTIKNAGKVLVLDQGRIAETGTHRQLMDRNGLYRQLYLDQMDAPKDDFVPTREAVLENV